MRRIAARRRGAGKRRIARFHPQRHLLADEAQRAVADQRAGQQTAFAENLEAVADADDQLARVRRRLHGGHHRRKPRDGPRAQVIAVRKTAGHDDGVETVERTFLVPDVFGVEAHVVAQGVETILVAVRAGEAEDGEFHRGRCEGRQQVAKENGDSAINRARSFPEFQPVILDHRIGEQVAAKGVELGFQRGAVARSGPARSISMNLPTRTACAEGRPRWWRASRTALPWGSSTACLGMTITRAFIKSGDGDHGRKRAAAQAARDGSHAPSRNLGWPASETLFIVAAMMFDLRRPTPTLLAAAALFALASAVPAGSMAAEHGKKGKTATPEPHASASPAATAAPTAAAAPEAPPLTAEQMASSASFDAMTVPTPGELFAALNKQCKPNWGAQARGPINTAYSDRAQAALNLGGLIADGYIAVEAQDGQQVKNLGRDILALAKNLGISKEILARGNSIQQFADDNDWNSLKEELEATQNEVKQEMDALHDEELVTLLSLGGWIRGTQVVSDVVLKNFSQQTSCILRQPALVEYLRGKLDKLSPEDEGLARWSNRWTPAWANSPSWCPSRSGRRPPRRKCRRSTINPPRWWGPSPKRKTEPFFPPRPDRFCADFPFRFPPTDPCTNHEPPAVCPTIPHCAAYCRCSRWS